MSALVVSFVSQQTDPSTSAALRSKLGMHRGMKHIEIQQQCYDEPTFTNYNISRHAQKLEMKTYKIISLNYMRALLYVER